MRTLFSILTLVALGLGPLSVPADAQTSSLDDVRLFQSHFRDSPISSSPYVEAAGSYGDFDEVSLISIGARLGVPIQSVFELGAEGAYQMWDFDGVDDDPSGIDRPAVYGRYNLVNDGEMSVSLGGKVVLPVGSEELPTVGEDPGVDFGFFGAGRYLVDDNIALTGTAGLDLIEVPTIDGETDRETDLVLGFGTVINTSEKLNLVGEILFTTETEYGALSGGVDYRLSDAARFRGAALIGLDDRAPDLGVQAGVLFAF